MQDNGLSNIAMSGGWHPMTVAALVVGAFVVTGLLIWDRIRIWERTRRIEAKLSRMEKTICLFEMQESKRFTVELHAKSGGQTCQRDTPAETSVGDVVGPSISPATVATQSRRRKNVKIRR